MRALLALPLVCLGLHAQAAFTVSYTVSSHHGYSVSCFGGADGAIDVTVTGTGAPFTYLWSTGATTQDLTGLVAGYYTLRVTDTNSAYKDISVTLTEPGALSARADVYEYSNTYNVSCYNCYNGSIDVTILGGISPYAIEWADAATTEDRSALGADNYSFTITDNNGCIYNSGSYTLLQPDRTDWTMNGNTGTNPATQFIGSTDNKDVVFKTNGSETLRLRSNGKVAATSLTFDSGYRLLGVDSSGALKIFDGLGDPYPGRINGLGCPNQYPWFLCGNSIAVDEFLGTLNDMPLKFKTNAAERMRIDADGKVGIGMVPPANSSSIYQLYVEGGIIARDVKVTINNFPDYVFRKDYALMSLSQMREYIALNGHLPTMPKGSDVEADGGMEVGDLQMRLLRTVEEQALYILQLEERLKAMEARVGHLEAGQR